MKQMTLGQYYPGCSFMHRLDPRIKVIGALLYIVAAFLCSNFFGIRYLNIIVKRFTHFVAVKTTNKRTII